MATQLYALAEEIANPVYRICARMALGLIRYHTLEFSDALELVEEGLAMYEELDGAQRESAMFFIGQNPGMACAFCVAYIHWLRGDADTSALMQRRAFEIGSELGSPFQVATGLGWSMTLHHLRRDTQASFDDATALLKLTDEHGFPIWSATARLHHGAARVAMDLDVETALQEIRTGVRALEDQNVFAFRTRAHAVFAEAAFHVGKLDEARDAIRDGRQIVNLCGERWWGIELTRLQAAIERCHPEARPEEAVSLLETAIADADACGIVALAFRASIDLARLYFDSGRRDEALAVLEPRYASLREGHTTPDVLEARTLLNSLNGFASEGIHGPA